jgi:cytochrome P450
VYLENPADDVAVGEHVEVILAPLAEMASRVLKDSQVFTLRKDAGAVAGLRWWMPRIFRVFTDNMLTVDEPDHTGLRGIADEAVRRRAVLDMEPCIRAIAGELADDIFAGGSPADLVTPLPESHTKIISICSSRRAPIPPPSSLEVLRHWSQRAE